MKPWVQTHSVHVKYQAERCVSVFPVTGRQTQEVPETFWSTSVPNLMISMFTKRPCFKAQGTEWLRKTVSANLWQAHRHAHASTPMNMHEHIYTEEKKWNMLQLADAVVIYVSRQEFNSGRRTKFGSKSFSHICFFSSLFRVPVMVTWAYSHIHMASQSRWKLCVRHQKTSPLFCSSNSVVFTSSPTDIMKLPNHHKKILKTLTINTGVSGL